MQIYSSGRNKYRDGNEHNRCPYYLTTTLPIKSSLSFSKHSAHPVQSVLFWAKHFKELAICNLVTLSTDTKPAQGVCFIAVCLLMDVIEVSRISVSSRRNVSLSVQRQTSSFCSPLSSSQSSSSTPSHNTLQTKACMCQTKHEAETLSLGIAWTWSNIEMFCLWKMYSLSELGVVGLFNAPNIYALFIVIFHFEVSILKSSINPGCCDLCFISRKFSDCWLYLY